MSKKVTFTLAPEIVANATEGLLLGDFNNWLHDKGIKLKKQKDGSLQTVANLEPGIYQYRYFLNDGRWVNDANAKEYSHVGEFGVENCVISVPFSEVKEKVATGAHVTDVKVAPKKEVKPATSKAVSPKATPPVAKAKAAPKKIEKAVVAKKVAETKVVKTTAKPAAKKAAPKKAIKK